MDTPDDVDRAVATLRVSHSTGWRRGSFIRFCYYGNRVDTDAEDESVTLLSYAFVTNPISLVVGPFFGYD